MNDISPELPKEIWVDRIANEVKSLERLKVLELNSVTNHENDVELIINVKALGFLKNGDELIPQKNHRVFLRIERAFPYPGGISFFWLSPIFHPNIHPVELPTPPGERGTGEQGPGERGTGYICLNVLKKWSRLSDLETTVKALQMLVENPNPDDPLNYPICAEATQFFKDNPMEKIREQFDFGEEEKKEDEDIIILGDDDA